MLAAGEEALQTWQDNCYAIYEEAGTTVDDFAAKTEEDMESVAENSQNAKNAIYDMVNNDSVYHYGYHGVEEVYTHVPEN